MLNSGVLILTLLSPANSPSTLLELVWTDLAGAELMADCTAELIWGWSCWRISWIRADWSTAGAALAGAGLGAGLGAGVLTAAVTTHSSLLHCSILIVAIRSCSVGDSDQSSGGVNIAVLTLHILPLPALLVSHEGGCIRIIDLVVVVVLSIGRQFPVVFQFLILSQSSSSSCSRGGSKSRG